MQVRQGGAIHIENGHSEGSRSATQPARDRNMTTEQRKYPRIECSGTAAVKVAPGEPPVPAHIANLSAGGCLLVLKEPRPLSQDTVVELTFRVNNLDEFQAPAQVRAKRSDTAIGFQFPALTDTVRRRLQHLLGQLIECLPATGSLSGYGEKRRHPRLGCKGAAAVIVAAGEPSIPATIVDLSAGGCRMVLRQPQYLPKDTLVELTFNVHHLSFRVRGQVRAIRSDSTIGFQFPVLSERARKQLDDLMKELMADMRKRQAERKRATLPSA
jgi:c-di-GMP-binding flagellar brake protein YcgR